jgi:hypothetical protein
LTSGRHGDQGHRPAWNGENMRGEGLNLVDLRQFTGTERWYRNASNPKVLFTDGAKYVADHAGAHWLLDEIALSQIRKSCVGAEGFQVWKLNVNIDMSAELICEDGDANTVYTKKIATASRSGSQTTRFFCQLSIKSQLQS